MFLLLLLAAVAAGAAVASLVEPDEPLAVRVLIGAPIGITLQALAAFVFASWLGLTPAVALAGAALAAGVPFLLWRRARAGARSPGQGSGRLPASLAVYLAVFAAFVWAFFSRAAYMSGGHLMTGEYNNYGDLGFHVGVIEGFVKGQRFPPEHPEMAGVRLSYPFLADFGVALLRVGGLDLPAALLAQNLLLALSLVVALYRFVLVQTRNRLAAMLAPVLVLLNGGLGFVIVFVESAETGARLLDIVRRPAHSYTILWGDWGEVLRWGNSLTTLLVTQRALLLGLPLALLVWTLWSEALDEESPSRRRLRLFAAGVLAGLLPLAHAHSYMALMPMAVLVALVRPRQVRDWGAFFLPAVALALPQIAWSTRGSAARAASFVGWQYGWTRPADGSFSLLAFWAVNVGLSLVGLAAFVWPGLLEPRRRLVLAPFLLWWIVPNLVRLSPWDWDNVKFLLYGYLALIPPLALLLARLLQGPAPARLVGAVAFVVLTASGGLDVWRVVSRSQEWSHFDPDAFAQARLLEAATPPDARILSAQSPSRPTLLSGRRTVVGLPFHIWSHGMDAEGPSADVRAMYAGGPTADVLLQRYAVDFVLVGPVERGDLAANEAYFASRCDRVGDAAGATLYRVRR
jgi:hypothetical protein